MPKVAIIILNWNGWPDTFECLKSLNQVDYDNFEIILIDNGSKGECRLPGIDYTNLKITLICNKENLGFAGGTNQGIKIALDSSAGGSAEYFLLLNNDTTVEPDFLKKLVAAAKRDPKVGILGPMIYFYDHDERLIWSAGGEIDDDFMKGKLISYRKIDRGGYKTGKVDYISGTCLLIKKEVVEKIGLISEDYFVYYEDTDWCVRAARAGWKCFFVSESLIYHKVSKSAGEFSYPYIYYHTRNGLLFCYRFGSKAHAYLASFWIFIKQVIKLLANYKRDWAWPVMRGVVDFWEGKKGKLEGYY